MLVSMADVAFLARVQRPVVTVWRRRYAGSPHPFPDPVRAEPPRFDADQVLDWLGTTGLGNNPDPQTDLPALRLRTEEGLDAAGAAGISATLVLRALYGDDLLEELEGGRRAERLLAETGVIDDGAVLSDLPPADECVGVAALVEGFLDQHFGALEAHDWLNAHVFRGAWPELAALLPAAPLAELIARAAVALAEAYGPWGILDEQGTAVGWLDRLPPEWPGRVAFGGIGAIARHARRMAILQGQDAEPGTGDGGFGVGVDLAFGEASLQTQARLAARSPARCRLVVGPARELCDPLTDDRIRDGVLRGGGVRAIVKLPAGLRATHPREHPALWLIADRPEQPFEEHRTFVADLSGHRLDEALITDLVGDLLAAAGSPEVHGHRSWRLLRAIRTFHLLARGGSLVATPPAELPAGREPRPAAAHVLELAESCGLADGLRATPSQASPAAPVTVAEAVGRRWVRELAGIRLPRNIAAGALPVWRVVGGLPVRESRLDPLTALALSRSWLTEPGDVVCSPGGHALIDETGGALVAYPARALRVLRGGPFTPQQVARAVEAAGPAGNRDVWWLRPLTPEGRGQLSAASGRIAERRRALLAELDQLQEFEDALLDACSNRLINLEVD